MDLSVHKHRADFRSDTLNLQKDYFVGELRRACLNLYKIDSARQAREIDQKRRLAVFKSLHSGQFSLSRKNLKSSGLVLHIYKRNNAAFIPEFDKTEGRRKRDMTHC